MKSIRTVRPSWDVGLIVVCRECDGYSKALRRTIKDALASEGLRKRVRVVASSCLDVCPKRATTIVAVTSSGSDVRLIPENSSIAEVLAPFVRRHRAEPSDPSL